MSIVILGYSNHWSKKEITPKRDKAEKIIIVVIGLVIENRDKLILLLVSDIVFSGTRSKKTTSFEKLISQTLPSPGFQAQKLRG